MIFTERKITIRNGKSSINEPVILYRGDYEVSIKFTITESKFRFKNGVNLVDSEKASHGQLAILTPYGGNVFSEIVKCEDGTVTFTLTKKMIDQLEEVGLYSFQIRLFDHYRESRVSIPPVEFGIEVREPVASEDHDNEVNNAIVGYSIAKVVDGLNEDVPDTLDDNGNYNKTDWETGDRITEGKLNKIEDAIDKINQNEKNDVAALDKRITSNYNVLDSRITSKYGVLESRMDTFTSLADGSTTGDAELADIRVDINGNIHSCAGGAVRYQMKSIHEPSNALFNIIGDTVWYIAEFDEIISGIVYNTRSGVNGDVLAKGQSYKMAVSPGEVLSISSTVFGSDRYGLAIFYDNNHKIIEVIERNIAQIETAYTDYIVTVPSRACLMIISCPSTSRAEVKKERISFTKFEKQQQREVEVTDMLTDISFQTKQYDSFKDGYVYMIPNSTSTALDHCDTFEYNVSEGEKYFVTSKILPHTAYGLVQYYDSNGNYVNCDKRSEGAELSVIDYEIEIPPTVTLMRICVKNGTLPVVKKQVYRIVDVVDKLEDVNDEISIIKSAIRKTNTITIQQDSIEPSVIYNKKENAPISFKGYSTVNYVIEEGKTYKLSTWVIANNYYAAAIFYDRNMVNLGYVLSYDEAQTTYITDVMITPPENAVLMKCCTNDTSTTLLCEVETYMPESIYADDRIGYPMSYAIDNGSISIAYKMGDQQDFVVNLRKKGGNNIFDFYSEGVIQNSSLAVSPDPRTAQVIASHSTDWHCPYIVGAINNIDGDNLNTDGIYNPYFTGGNHQYNNSGSGSTATGRTDVLRFFIDGRETTEGVGYAMNNIEIRWVNYVQGYNTTKSDGTGREILKEIHTLIFDGRVFNTHVEVIPLEDINMRSWYGFQCSRGTLFNVSSRFIGGVNRETFTSNLSSVDCGEGKAHTMIHEGTTYGIKITLDPLYDMGANDNRTTPYAFNSGNKSYFNLTDRASGINMTANNSYYIRGSYEFFIL